MPRLLVSTVFAAVMLTVAVYYAGRLVAAHLPRDPRTLPPRPAFLAPRCAALCKIAMGVTMSYMLILML